MIILCEAQYVDIACYGRLQLTCNDYTFKSNKTRTINFNGLNSADYAKVTTLTINHPPLHIFLTEIFTSFPNLQMLDVSTDGSTAIPPFGFINATNLVDLRIDQTTMAPLNNNAFYGANKLTSIRISSILRLNENAFAGLTNLVCLEILSSDIGPWPLPKNIFSPLINLKKLTLWNINISKIPATLFANNLNLELLGIVDDLVAVEKTFVENLKNLKHIYIFGQSDGPCSRASWTYPDPISQFHSAMSQCYSRFAN